MQLRFPTVRDALAVDEEPPAANRMDDGSVKNVAKL
jgi:hypothetical protein